MDVVAPVCGKRSPIPLNPSHGPVVSTTWFPSLESFEETFFVNWRLMPTCSHSAPFLQLPLLRNLHSLCKRSHSRVDREPFLLQLPQIVPQRRQRNAEALDIFILLELRLQVLLLVARIRHVDFHKDHLGVCVAEARVVEHYEPLCGLCVGGQGRDIACLFLEFADGAGSGVFAFVDQATGNFDRDFVERRAELFLE
jgi:hypothetical protein